MTPSWESVEPGYCERHREALHEKINACLSRRDALTVAGILIAANVAILSAAIWLLWDYQCRATENAEAALGAMQADSRTYATVAEVNAIRSELRGEVLDLRRDVRTLIEGQARLEEAVKRLNGRRETRETRAPTEEPT